MSVLVEGPAVRLTPRQGEFLALFAAGKTRKEIGATCFVSPWTVRDALLEAQHRLEADSLRQAIAKAIALGILCPCRDGTVEIIALNSVSS